jgi:predicted CopG family antitoxin
VVKTITIRDSVYKRLVAAKSKEESFSKLFERLLEGNKSAADALGSLRGSVEFDQGSKARMLSEIEAKRNERRSV